MMEGKKDEEKFHLEKAFDNIEEILKKLGDKEISLEESFVLYQKGMQLLKQCNENIDCVEKQMLEIDEEGLTREFS